MCDSKSSCALFFCFLCFLFGVLSDFGSGTPVGFVGRGVFLLLLFVPLGFLFLVIVGERQLALGSRTRPPPSLLLGGLYLLNLVEAKIQDNDFIARARAQSTQRRTRTDDPPLQARGEVDDEVQPVNELNYTDVLK